MPNDKRLHQNDNSVSFYEMVYQVVELIPVGKVTTYGAIAKYLGAAKSSRMVGWALNSTKGREMPIPAHRVVNRLGLLTGKSHFRGKPMEELLMEEGVSVKDGVIQNFDHFFWDPEKEINV